MSLSKKEEFNKKFIVDIKNFIFIRQIGSGAFGSVCLVQDISSKKEYAAKIINFGKNEDEYKKMIDREVGILIRFQHPTIIKFYGFSPYDFSGQKNVTLIMELAKNGSLEKILEKSRKGLADSNYDNTARQIILVGIARGMMYFHQHRAIHRDLKPGNILLDEFFHPHITDFGLSKLYEAGHSKSQSQQCGTMSYMAPEVISGDKYNGKADVYSFGILMYEVVTDTIAYPLFENGTMPLFEFSNKVVYQDYRPVFTVSVKPSIKKLIEECWSPNPSERPNFDQIFKKLAFKEEDEIYNVDCPNDADDYYLESVDVDELQFYIDDINDIFSQEKSGIQIDDLNKKFEIIKEKAEENKKENERSFQSSQKLENEIQSLKRKYGKMKGQINNLLTECTQYLTKYQQILSFINTLEKRFTYSDLMTIGYINNFSLKFQQNIFSKIISYSSNKMNSEHGVVMLHDFLRYANQIINPTTKLKFIEIEANDVQNLFNYIFSGESKYSQFPIRFNCVELPQKLLKSNYFTMQLNKFSKFSILLKYPSKSFTKIYDLISEMKKEQSNQISFSLYITGIQRIEVDLSNQSLIDTIIVNSTVETIYSLAFACCLSLREITIPSSVTSIGFHAFENCKSLKQITFVSPSMVQSFKSHVFHGCTSLESIDMPSSLVGIADFAFYGCKSLRYVEIPETVQVIGPSAFEECSSLSQISCSNCTSLKFIGIKAFMNCRSLRNISLPTSLVNISDEMLSYCSSLCQLTIPSSVATIGKDAFYFCSSLTSIVVPDSVTSIGKGAFSGCSSLAQITLSNRLSAILALTFWGCSSLRSIYIPESVRIIQYLAFVKCEALSSVKILSRYVVIENKAFDECSSLSNVTVSFYAKQISPEAFPYSARIEKI